MTDERNPRAAELLRKAFCLSDEQISVVPSDLMNASDMLPKLKYLTEHYPPIDWSDNSASALITRPFFKLTYDEFLFCASLPERLRFTEEEREKYDGLVLYWNCIIRLLLPFRYPIKLDTLIFGGISISICTWSGHTSAFMMFTPFQLHNCLKICPISSLLSP